MFNEYEYDIYNQNNVEKAYREIYTTYIKDFIEKYVLNLETINKYVSKYNLAYEKRIKTF